MTGRARGRARGRGRSGPPSEAPRRPGEQEGAAAPSATSRGRSRGAAPPAAAASPPSQTPAAAAAGGPAPPTQAMAAMSVGERPSGGRRYNPFQEVVCRPQSCVDKTGSAGSKIPIASNYFKLNTIPGGMIYQYNVSFSPEVDNKKVRLAMINGQGELLGRPRAFDGMVLFMPKKLPETVTKVVTHRRSDDSAVEITITLTNEVPAGSPSCLQLYNIIFRRILSMMDMKQIQRSYYKTDSPIPIPKHHLELWPGFITSILQYEENIMLCAEVSHKVLRKETVLEFLYDLNDITRKKGIDFHDEATKKVVGEIVLTRYNNKTYRVDDINWNGKPSDTFTLYDGTEITFADYYQKAYNKVIQDPLQPLLVTKPKKKFGPGGAKLDDRPCYLLPELCYMTGLSDEMRSDFHLMKDLATHTRVGPQERNDSLQKFMSDMRRNKDCSQELSGWGLQFDEKLINLEGRVLPPETIFQKDQRFNYKPAEADWSREMRGAKLISTVPLSTWMILFTSRDSGIAHDFLQTLHRVCGPMNIQVQKPLMCELRDDKTETYLRTMQEKMNDNVCMVTCILPTNRKDRYDAIKKFCCVSKPVSSQVIVSRTLSKKQMLMSVATKIGIQLNCKLGGEVWAVEIPLKNLMVIGIDCYHDSLSKGKSISGFVASTNSSLTRYYSRCTSQHTGQELVDGIKVCVTGALRRYNEINKTLPDRIIVYRDGVGDGQLAAVLEHEVKQFIECFRTVGYQQKPKFAFVVVKKRVNTRFFLKNGRLQNPPPGSVVDKEVTKKEWYDFFLVSQSVRQGTVTPTHYNVIHDTTGLKADHMQRLTYKLTHLYYNWPGTIRVPAPCQYAHKLAYLVGTSIHAEPDISLADRLYYL